MIVDSVSGAGAWDAESDLSGVLIDVEGTEMGVELWDCAMSFFCPLGWFWGWGREKLTEGGMPISGKSVISGVAYCFYQCWVEEKDRIDGQ